MELKLNRKFVPENLEVSSFQDIAPLYSNLMNRELNSEHALWQWLLDRSELEAVLSEDMAWRYIKMNCNTANKELQERFNHFVSTIEPEITKASNALDKKFFQQQVLRYVDAARLFVVIREVKKDLELFREENVPLEAKLQQKEQEFGSIASKMLVNFDNKELTLQQAANYLKEPHRDTRKKVYELINERRKKDAPALNKLLTQLIKIRHQIAQNAGFRNYRDFKFRDLGRFDYTPEDCVKFHQSVAKEVVPLVNEIYRHRKKKLGVDVLKPYDLDVDENQKAPLKPFTNATDLVRKATFCFRDLEPEFGIYLNEMNKKGHLDLESRKNKAPGGFNYPLHESNIPFIYMNATGNLRDMITMLHEGGHAVHSFLTAHLELVDFKDTPAEIAELASMSMELITMDYWHHFFDNTEDLNRAKRTHLQDVITVLPWVATIDKFQHFLYENPQHTEQERTQAWLSILNEFSSEVIDFKNYEEFRAIQWQKQLHIFEVPFYYIEYGIAQLGAIAVWRNYKKDKKKALAQFKQALKMGYTSPLPDTYKAAGIAFDFSQEYIRELMDFVKAELVQLK